MKKKLALLCTAVLAFGLLAGCGGAKEEAKQPETSTETPSAGAEQGQYKDGNYFAKGTPDDKGWMYMVKLEVKDGKITAVNWDGANTKTAGDTKKQLSESGKYGMKAGGAQSEWHEQAKKMEDALIEKQDPKAIAVKEGKTDAVSGVSIHVGDFVTLADQALAAGPVEAGQFKDGGYHAEGKDFDDKGWKETVDVTVFNGQIVAANWDNINKDGKETKKQKSIAGTYGMNWHEQAKKMEDELIAKQDPAALVVKEDGTQDAVTGVSVHVGGFVKLAQEALASAK